MICDLQQSHKFVSELSSDKIFQLERGSMNGYNFRVQGTKGDKLEIYQRNQTDYNERNTPNLIQLSQFGYYFGHS